MEDEKKNTHTSGDYGRAMASLLDFLSNATKETSGPPPGTIFHYTTYRGLQGIIGDGGIFLTDARFLNDASELQYGRDLTLNNLLTRVSAGDQKREIQETVERAVTEVHALMGRVGI
jgi:hypothetical protein